MTSSSDCFFLVSMVILLQFFLVSASASASTKYINTLCRMEAVHNKTFCLQTLTSYPPAASATSLFSLAEIVISLGLSHAEKAEGFAAEAAKNEPALEKQFKLCNKSYISLAANLRIAKLELKKEPTSANYDVTICHDHTSYVKDLIGKNKDKDSKRLMEMTFLMEKLLRILLGATEAVGG